MLYRVDALREAPVQISLQQIPCWVFLEIMVARHRPFLFHLEVQLLIKQMSLTVQPVISVTLPDPREVGVILARLSMRRVLFQQ